MGVVEIVGLGLAAFAAGAVNAVAGGGSLISFPALIAAGYPARTANVTNTVALWPGYVGGSLGYRWELRSQTRRIVHLLIPTIAGGLTGSVLLLSTPEDTFEVLAPFLIIVAATLMLFQNRLAGFAEHHSLNSRGGDHVPALLHVCVFGAAVYGAYFGGALGIIILAVLLILLPDDIQRSNALKGFMSLVINAVAVGYFAAFGPVQWGPALVMAVAAMAGGYSGVYIARVLGAVWLRRAVILFGYVVAIVLIIRL